MQVAVGTYHKGFKWPLARDFKCRSGNTGGPDVGADPSDRDPGAGPRAAPGSHSGGEPGAATSPAPAEPGIGFLLHVMAEFKQQR